MNGLIVEHLRISLGCDIILICFINGLLSYSSVRGSRLTVRTEFLDWQSC